jgi:hypothetical protein
MALTTSAPPPTRVEEDGTLTFTAESVKVAGLEPGDQVFLWRDEQGELHVRRIDYLTAHELIERFPIATTIDMNALRAAWEAAAADEVLAEMERNATRPD